MQHGLSVLSKAYLAFSLAQRRERLSEGLRFLNQQEPVLADLVNTLQGKLADFRRRHNLLTPESEATALKVESLAMATQRRLVQTERSRLLKLRADIASGRLNAASFASVDIAVVVQPEATPAVAMV